jgi:hypothetical protein
MQNPMTEHAASIELKPHLRVLSSISGRGPRWDTLTLQAVANALKVPAMQLKVINPPQTREQQKSKSLTNQLTFNCIPTESAAAKQNPFQILKAPQTIYISTIGIKHRRLTVASPCVQHHGSGIGSETTSTTTECPFLLCAANIKKCSPSRASLHLLGQNHSVKCTAERLEVSWALTGLAFCATHKNARLLSSF